MQRCIGSMAVVLAGWLVLGSVPGVWGQDTPSANATRKKLQTKISVEYKEIATKEIFDDIKREMDSKVSFKIDNVSGISNNSKLTIKAKEQTLEKILNDLCDKYEFGYVVISKPNDRYDGWILIRKAKGKERGYEAGKEPKKSSALPIPPAALGQGFSLTRLEKQPGVAVRLLGRLE